MQTTDTDARTAELERRVYAKVTWRLIPFLFLCYICAYLDRVNVGFAKLQMCADRGFSDTAYGIGAGIFFLGYFLLEVPSNLMLQRFGARRWIARIMVTWGVISASMTFVTSVGWFYLLRFVLGAAEAGFFPGIILYLTYWYTQGHRARIVALFMTAIAVSGIVGGPISGGILSALSGAWGLAGWQWLFILEGIPSVVVGLAVLAWLDDGPRQARWIDEEERTLLLSRLADEERAKRTGGQRHTLGEAITSGRVWVLAAVYFGAIMGLYGVSFWLPQIVEDLGVASPFRVGLITMVPWAAAALGMVAIGQHSDSTGERRWHIAGSAIAGALGFIASALFVRSLPISLIALTVATVAVMAVISTFWSLPTATLSGTAAAAGIALINSVGNLAGYVSPMIVGRIKDATGSVVLGLYVLAGSLLGSGLIVLWLTWHPTPGHHPRA